MAQYFLGIDGGGTKTEAVLCDASGHVLYRQMTAPTNPNDVGIRVALDRLCRLLESVHFFVTRERGEDATLALFAGISGALNHREALLAGMCRDYPNDRISVDSDAINLLSSELADGDGCCLICGTGSVCFVRCGEKITRIGGWGYLLDASGSGFSMGREALEAALRSHDGRGDATLLTGAVMEKLGGAPWDKLTELYEGGKPLIASFAPCVLQCADRGDRIAIEILFRQSVYLANCLDAAYRVVGDWERPLEVVLGGGLFQSSADLVSLLRQNVTVPVRLTLASAPPVFGAVWEAFRRHCETVTLPDYELFRENFLISYLSE